jgi:hypothetical protein
VNRRKRGFKKVEMGARFAGVKVYRGRGYEDLVDQGVEGVEERKLGNGDVLRLGRLGRSLREWGFVQPPQTARWTRGQVIRCRSIIKTLCY